jgi:mannose-6-phosphate isomerase-like protein (cupin superfamily)
MAWSKYPFRGHTGYIVAPWIPGVAHGLVAIRHSASVPPWADGDIHLHADSEEYYFVLQGELRLLVDGAALTLRPHEALWVRPGVPHAVVGGRGPIEHFVVRTPGSDDRRSVGTTPPELPPLLHEGKRALQPGWGCRVPLTEARYQNCWLFGFGGARFHSDHLTLAYLDLPTDESADASWRRHPHQLHLHRESWEVYTALQGRKTLAVEDRLVEINAGEILEIPPGVRHVARAIRTPFRGFTLRVPQSDDKVVIG